MDLSWAEKMDCKLVGKMVLRMVKYEVVRKAALMDTIKVENLVDLSVSLLVYYLVAKWVEWKAV